MGGPQQAQLFGGKLVAAAGARVEQVKLHFLDPVLGLAAGAVQPFVQIDRFALDVGHHESRAFALGAVSERGDHPPLDISGVGCVGELVDEP